MLDTSCKWNHTTCRLLWLVLSLCTFWRFVHVVVCISTSFHGMDILHFIYPFLSWCIFGLFPTFGYYHAVMHIHVQVLCGRMFSFFSGICLGMELLGHMATLYQTVRLLLKWLPLSPFPPAVYISPQPLTSFWRGVSVSSLLSLLIILCCIGEESKSFVSLVHRYWFEISCIERASSAPWPEWDKILDSS